MLGIARQSTQKTRRYAVTAEQRNSRGYRVVKPLDLKLGKPAQQMLIRLASNYPLVMGVCWNSGHKLHVHSQVPVRVRTCFRPAPPVPCLLLHIIEHNNLWESYCPLLSTPLYRA